MHGYVYILSNPFYTGLVKIGFTDRDPYLRARELSSHTGVPGEFSVIKFWIVQDAYDAECSIHNFLQSYRVSGEFFKIEINDAIEKIKSHLIDRGIINLDGNSFELKVIEDNERLKNERESRREKVINDQKSFHSSFHAIYHKINLDHEELMKVVLKDSVKTSFWGKEKIDKELASVNYLKLAPHKILNIVNEVNLAALSVDFNFQQKIVIDDIFFLIGRDGLYKLTKLEFDSIRKYQHFQNYMHRIKIGTAVSKLVEYSFNSDNNQAMIKLGKELVSKYCLGLNPPFRIPAETKIVTAKSGEKIDGRDYAAEWRNSKNDLILLRSNSKLISDVLIDKKKLTAVKVN